MEELAPKKRGPWVAAAGIHFTIQRRRLAGYWRPRSRTEGRWRERTLPPLRRRCRSSRGWRGDRQMPCPREDFGGGQRHRGRRGECIRRRPPRAALKAKRIAIQKAT